MSRYRSCHVSFLNPILVNLLMHFECLYSLQYFTKMLFISVI